MTTLIVKINERSSLGKAIMELLRSTAKESKAVEVVEDKSPYSPEFVAKVKRASKEKGIIINPHDVWGSLGLR